MEINTLHVVATAEPVAELDCLGDEIAELAAHLDAATARLLELIREFDGPPAARANRVPGLARRASRRGLGHRCLAPGSGQAPSDRRITPTARLSCTDLTA